MKKGMKSAFAATLALTACFGGISAYAAFDENLNVYTLDAVVVEADKTKNKFGDTVTEQSYYRTGGDVKVITREEIEKRHYTDVTEAIKRVPGVTFTMPVIVAVSMVIILTITVWLSMGIQELLFS